VTKRKHYINKGCTKIDGPKILINPMKKKRFYLICQWTKVQKVGIPKNERVKKT